MKDRKYKMFIEDILASMENIENYIKDLEFEEFEADKMRIDAVIRNLEVRGEVAKNIPEEIRKKYPNIPWKKMIGLRNITIHEYFGVDLSIIWEIISRNIPETKPEIVKVLEKLE